LDLSINRVFNNIFGKSLERIKKRRKKGVPQSELFSSKALFFVRNRIYFQSFKSEKETYL
ncbi:hypothetical protein, partial [Clostridioides difficile]|uniref:hypothetical protein n=1 Tax=Clostridioides difficile TaxID=1496 RepID=UPI001A8C9218